MRLVQLGDALVEVHVRRSVRVRSSRAVFRPGLPPEVVVPASASERAVDRALDAHRPWLEWRLAEQPAPVLRLEPGLTDTEGRRRAGRILRPILEAEARLLGVSFQRLTVRDQRTRWGSCSSRGTLSFNWRLVLAPREVLDYVAVHELCHLRVPNHSAGFWRLLEQRRPGYGEPRAWLARHGWELMAYGPPK